MNSLELLTALEVIFAKPINHVRRTRSPYSSSFTIEELDLAFGDRTELTVIFKNLSSDAMLEDARRARPGFICAPEREIQVYRSLLAPLDLGTPKMYGAIVEPAHGRYWLFLEKVAGQELYEVGEFEIWLRVARWLARLHASSDSDAARAAPRQLLECDASYYWCWLERARQSAGSTLDRIAARYDRVVEILLGLPQALIHGEFYASNILVSRQENVRVCPVDWEMAATGPGLLDVAALASGKWNRYDRLRILEAYHQALPERFRLTELVRAFDCCQLHIALQWLGWSRTWTAPEAHAHNWMDDALRISQEDSLAAVFA